jgi:hypothetical protein
MIYSEKDVCNRGEILLECHQLCLMRVVELQNFEVISNG